MLSSAALVVCKTMQVSHNFFSNSLIDGMYRKVACIDCDDAGDIEDIVTTGWSLCGACTPAVSRLFLPIFHISF